MKKGHVVLIGNSIFALALCYLTVASLFAVRNISHTVMFGWLIFSPVGYISSAAMMVWLIVIFAADALWLLYWGLRLLRRLLHIRSDDNDNTLYLP